MNENLIKYLDKYGLTGQYSGGNDSGGLDNLNTVIPDESFEMKGFNMDDLSNWVYDNSLSHYGSWAGEWSAYGSIRYDKETKCIIVAGSEESEEDVKLIKEEQIFLKDFFNADDLARVHHVDIIFTDRTEDTTVRIHVENGPWSDTLQQAEDDIVKRLEQIEVELSHDEGDRYTLQGEFKPETPITLEIWQLVTTPMEWVLDLNEMEFTKENARIDE